jgi:UDP-N-acetylmuramate: L-alanyl-gamma-D-glutamyl-meso-diaminopimelate ligase
MRLHVLGVCGTFMGGIAALARELGHEVEGSDQNVYPPMSTQLEALGIRLHQGYRAEHLQPAPDRVLVGNALSRGNAAVEHLLDSGIPYVSGPQWLGETVLSGRRVLAVAGTHGKTTTTGLLGLDPRARRARARVPGRRRAENFGVSARLGRGAEFVLEATSTTPRSSTSARSSCTTGPRSRSSTTSSTTTPTSFRTWPRSSASSTTSCASCPGKGRLIVNGEDRALAEVLAMGSWSPIERFAIDAEAEWQASTSRGRLGLLAAASRASVRARRVADARPPQRDERARRDRGLRTRWAWRRPMRSPRWPRSARPSDASS